MNELLKELAEQLKINIPFEFITLDSVIYDYDGLTLESISHIVFKIDKYFIQIEQEGHTLYLNYTTDLNEYLWTNYGHYNTKTQQHTITNKPTKQTWNLKN